MQDRTGIEQRGCIAVCRYCSRLQAPSFWGGEVEILVLSRMLHAPIYVYRSAQEAGRCGLPILALLCSYCCCAGSLGILCRTLSGWLPACRLQAEAVA